MNTLNDLSIQILAELVAQAILLALPLVAVFLAARSRRVARTTVRLGQVRHRIAEEAHRNGNNAVYVDELNQAEADQAVRPLDRHIAPVWSPDSTRLAWGTDHHDTVELYVADLSTGSILCLTRHTDPKGFRNL